MARPSYYVETPDGKKVQLDVPENASAEQIRTLAARALKQKFPEAKYGRPALSKEASQSLLPEAARGELTADDTAISRVSGGIQGALAGLGVDERYAAHLGNRATSALNDLTPVGDLVTLSDARDAWNEGNYLGALGRGALAGIGLIPGVGDVAAGAAKAMFLGVGARNADRAALARAEELTAAGADRKEIWNETGWFQGADNKWRFEVPDNDFAFDQRAVRNLPKGQMRPFPEVAAHPALSEAYPLNTRTLLVGNDTGDLKTMGSFQEKMGHLQIQPYLFENDARSTAAHELQHFVQGQEGFARGGMVGTIPARQVDPDVAKLEDQIHALTSEMDELAAKRDPVTNRMTSETRWHFLARQRERLQDIHRAKSKDLGYEGYRRLAGEVEARNVQTRLDMTPGQRREYAPWETEDVPREDQFVIWHGDQPQGALEGVRVDNPGGEWLDFQREDAAAASARGRRGTGAVTAYTPGAAPLPLSILRDVPGARGEVRRPGDPQYDELLEAAQREGFREDAPILVGVDYDGQPYIIEGNTRVAVASALGRETVPGEIKWYAGAEQADRLHPDFTLEAINRILTGR